MNRYSTHTQYVVQDYRYDSIFKGRRLQRCGSAGRYSSVYMYVHCSVSQKKMFFIRQVIAFGLNNGQQIGLDIPLFCKILKIQNILIDFPFSLDVQPVN